MVNVPSSTALSDEKAMYTGQNGPYVHETHGLLGMIGKQMVAQQVRLFMLEKFMS